MRTNGCKYSRVEVFTVAGRIRREKPGIPCGDALKEAWQEVKEERE
jgi:hypothetical protein